MPDNGLNVIVRHMRRRWGTASNDGALLAHFVHERDEAAFAELVRRYGRLVLNVALRQLGDRQQAEDVLQATFLDLARQAHRLGQPESLVNWLYTVALRHARKVRDAAGRRETLHRGRTPPRFTPSPLDEVSGRELVAVIDAEIARLPEYYRLPVLLCALEGLSRDEAASRLGWSMGTLRGRLERGRELLRQRLTKRGLTVPAVFAGTMVVEGAAVSGELARTVTCAALATPVCGAGSLKIATAAVLLVTMVGVGIGVTTRSEPSTPPLPSAVSPPQPAARVDILGDLLPSGAIARLGTQRLRPGSEINTLAFSPDGRKLACWAGTLFNSARSNFTLWDVATGKLLRRVNLPRVQILCLHWLPDGRGCAVVRTGRDERYVWDFADESASPPEMLAGAGQNGSFDGLIISVAVSPDGRWMATGRRDAQNNLQGIDVLELAVNKPLADLKARRLGTVPGHCVGLLFTPDGKTLLSLNRTQELDGIGAGSAVIPGKWSERAKLIAWDLATDRQKTTCEVGAPGPPSPTYVNPLPRTAALSPDGQTLIIGQFDGVVRFWDWQTGRERRSFVAFVTNDPKYGPSNYGPYGVVALAISGDGQRLFTAGLNGPRKLWDLATGRAVGLEAGISQFHAIAVSPDGQLLATGGNSGPIEIMRFSDGADGTRLPGHHTWIWQLRVLGDGRTALTAGTDRTVCRWDLASGKALGQTVQEKPAGGAGTIWPSMFTQDGRGLFAQSGSTVEANNETYLWETETGRRQDLAAVFADTSRSLLSPPAQGAVLLLDRADGSVSLRDWPSGRLRQKFTPPAFEDPANSHGTLAAAQSDDGRLVAVVGRDNRKTGDSTFYGSGRVSLFDTTTSHSIHRWGTPNAYFDHVGFVPDGSGVVVGGRTIPPLVPFGLPPRVTEYKGDQTLLLLDVAVSEPVRVFLPPASDATKHRIVSAVAISPDSRQIAAAEPDNSVWVYELTTGQARRHLVGHDNLIDALAFTPDSRRLVSTSRDLTGLVWDVSLAAGKAGNKPTQADLDRLWSDISKTEWEIASPALATLAAYPDVAVALFRDCLHPSAGPGPDVQAIDKLVRQLDSTVLTDRDQATAELRRLDLDALSHLRRRAVETTSEVVRLRLAQAVQEFVTTPLSPERLREQRAVELLEQMATPPAVDLLRKLASGAPGTELTRAAAGALGRIELRK